MDRLDTLKLLLRVIETKSFSGPARELGIGQPAVSKAIARLERELGLALVGRTTRTVSATAGGQRLVDELGPLVRGLDEGIGRLARGESSPSGSVRLAVAPGFGRACIVPVMRALRVEHPGISVELAVTDRLADLVSENIDLAVRAGTLAGSGHVVRRIGETPLLTVGSTGYLARHAEPREPSDLADHECVVFFTRGARRAWRFGHPKVTSLHPTRVGFRSSSADDIRAAVLADLGLAQVPGWLVARDLGSGAMQAVLRQHEPAPLPLFFVRIAHGRPPERVRVVENYVRRELTRAAVLAG
jgi:DNA-binding transcriptional LysR family regulator